MLSFLRLLTPTLSTSFIPLSLPQSSLLTYKTLRNKIINGIYMLSSASIYAYSHWLLVFVTHAISPFSSVSSGPTFSVYWSGFPGSYSTTIFLAFFLLVHPFLVFSSSTIYSLWCWLYLSTSASSLHRKCGYFPNLYLWLVLFSWVLDPDTQWVTCMKTSTQPWILCLSNGYIPLCLFLSLERKCQNHIPSRAPLSHCHLKGNQGSSYIYVCNFGMKSQRVLFSEGI